MKLLRLLMLIPAMGLMGAMEYPRSFSYTYKLTVTVRDQGFVSQASSVVRVHEEVSTRRNIKPPKMCGSATAIPLRSGKVLFALLNGPYHDPVGGNYFWRSAPTGVLLKGLNLPVEWAWQDDSGIRKLPGIKRPVILSSDQMPEFVTFRNNSSPLSIVQVDPDHADRVLGNGVRIERVKIEITDAKVTADNITRWLPWFDPKLNYLDGPRRFQTRYHSSQFSRCDR